MTDRKHNTASEALSAIEAACSKLSAEECAERLRRHQYNVAENMAINVDIEDQFTVSHDFSLKGLRWFLAVQEHMESMLPDEAPPAE